MTFELAVWGLKKSTLDLVVNVTAGLAEQVVFGQDNRIEGRARVPLPSANDIFWVICAIYSARL